MKISCFASRGVESHLEHVFSATSLKEEEIGRGQALGRSFSLQAHQTGESLHLLARSEWGLQEDHCVKGAPTPGTGAACLQQSPTLKAITAGIFYSSSLVSIPLPSALPLDHSNLGKREKLYCKKSTELGVRSPGSWLGRMGEAHQLSRAGFPAVFVRPQSEVWEMFPFVRKSSDLGPMTLLLGTLPLLNSQLLFSQLGSF